MRLVQDVQDGRGVGHGHGQGSDMVHGPRVRDDPGGWHRPVGGLEADDAAEGGGHPDRRPGVGGERCHSHARRDRDRRAAARASGDPGPVVRVAALGRRDAEGELVGGDLGDDDGPGGAQAGHRPGVDLWHVLVHGRARTGGGPRHVDDVLDRHGDPVQGPAVLARRQLGVQAGCLPRRLIRHEVDDCPQAWGPPLDGLEGFLDEPAARPTFSAGHVAVSATPSAKNPAPPANPAPPWFPRSGAFEGRLGGRPRGMLGA